MDSTERKVEEKLAENAVTSTESSAKTQKKKVSKESNPKKEKAAKVIINNNDNSVVEDEENICEISTSSKSELSVPKGKQQGKKRSKGEAESVSQDNPIEKEAEVKLSLKDNKRSSSQTCYSEVKKVSKELDSQKNGARKVVKKKTTSLEQERESKESRNSNEEATSSSEVSDQKEASKDAAHSEKHPPKPHKPSFSLKRSPASTDVRIPLDEGTARKKSLPKLVKAFKPPMAKEGKTGKGSKMPNLLKPSFVSPALAKPESKPDEYKEGGQAQSNALKKSTVSKKESTLKRKASKKDQCLSETPKKSKKDKEHDDILSGKVYVNVIGYIT